MSNKLTPEELEQVKNIRKQYADIAYSLGENQLQKRNLLNQYDNFALEINYDLYVRLYSAMYLSLVSLDPIRADQVAHIIRRYYCTHPHFKQQFDNLRSICGMNHFLTS